MNEKHKYVIITIALVTILMVSSSALFTTSVSGYQSMTAEWYQVVWPNAQTGTKTFIKPLNGTTFNWNPDATGIETGGEIPDGADDMSTIAGQVESLKFVENINYNHWWLNDTVSASNPEGEARHFEWAIDLYTINVNFNAIGGSAYFINPPQIWVELENNYQSVFNVLGAEDAVSYVLYAQTEEYSWAPESAGWHIINPTVGNFDIIFLDGTEAVPPAVPENGSDLDFEALEPYSHVAIPFELTEFGTAPFGSAPTVNMLVELNILTMGRWDYALTYVEAGEDQMAPIGALGILDGIGAALGAGFGALMDGFTGLAEGLTAPLIAIAVIVGAIVVIFIVLKMGGRDG